MLYPRFDFNKKIKKKQAFTVAYEKAALNNLQAYILISNAA